MQIISKNSKTGYSVNFPIEQTCDKTCPFYQNRTCYGLKGRFPLGAVKAANESRYALYKTFPNAYFEMLHKELEKLRDKGVTHIRVNGIGDTPDEDWAWSFQAVAKRLPEIQFWVMTRKKFWQFPSNHMPPNVIVRYSHGLKGEHTSAVVYDAAQATCPATTGEVSDCKACGYKCWSKDIPHVSYMKH